MENPEIPGRIQMAPFIPVEIFRQKSNTFRGIIFFPFLPKRPKFSVSFVWITSARLHVEREWKMRRYFVNGTTQSRSCFRCQKKYQYHLTGKSHRNFRTNGKRPQSCFFTVNLPKEDLYWPLHQMGLFHNPKIQDKPYPHPHFSLLFAHHSLFWVVLWMNWGTCYYQDGYFWPSNVLNYNIRY